MKRREFITLLGGAATTWPLAARAQQPAMPVIGFMSARSADDREGLAAAFRRGLSESGLVEGRNVAIEYRWAEFQYDRLPAIAVDLVRRNVAVIAAISGTPSALAAKAATTTIPIVFAMGSDPVASGVVNSLNHPGGNVTGASFFTTALGPKRLELLRELVANTPTIGVLVNPKNPVSTAEATSVAGAAQTVSQQIHILNATVEGDIEGAFKSIVEQRIDALLLTGDPFFHDQREKLARFAALHSIPAIYFDRELTVAGGLLSYGTVQSDTYRQAGIYVARIVKGANPADLPVVLPTKFQLVINLKTAKVLGIDVPPTLLARADEVIE